ncbi:MAG: NusG domain II-containing protein [Treponema sp.]|nr:NusG domain II-containing protein [Treponema sp.]
MVKPPFPLFSICSFFSKFFNNFNFPVSFKPLDAAVLLLSLGTVIFSVFVVYSKPHDNAQVSIRGENDAWLFPLDAEETITICGPLGDTVVEIHGNRVRVLSSSCANQTCIAQGHIKAAGQWIACLPNNVFMVIESSEKSGEDLDASTW